MWAALYRKVLITVLALSLSLSVSLQGKEFFWKSFERVKIDDRVAVLNMKYVEKKANYDRFLKEEIVNLAKECKSANLKYLSLAEKKFGVPKEVIVAIMTVESLCGKYKEKYYVASVYKTLLKLKEDKAYQDKIFKIVKSKYPDTTLSYFRKRVRKKSKWAYAQIKALERIHRLYFLDVFNLKGSWAGAFGIPQFIPTAFISYAVDGDGDGKVDISNFPDAIFSIANYLKKSGWKKGLSYKGKIKVILRYNYSRLYADTVLKLSQKIR